MSTVEILLIGIGLSMDAFAVAICKGLGMRRINYRHTFIIALFFGGFQALMPFLGWLLGSRFAQYITRYDHWIAFVLLLFIGGKMVWDTLHEDGKGEEEFANERLDLKELLLMAVALFAWWLQTRLVGEKEVTSVTGKPGENRGASLGWMTLPALLVVILIIFVL